MRGSGNETEDEYEGCRLSPSAERLLSLLRSIEIGRDVDVFEIENARRLRDMVATHRGSLYQVVVNRVRRAGRAGDGGVLTQQEILMIIEQEWHRGLAHLSDSELRVLGAMVNDHRSSALQKLAAEIGLTYSRTRRAYRRLLQTGLLRTQAILNVGEMGLARILVVLVEPTFVISSPYVEKTLYCDGPTRIVFQTLTAPRERVSDIVVLVRSLRTTSESVRVWRLSTGRLRFSSLYYNQHCGRRRWTVDPVILHLLLRHTGEPVVMGTDEPVGTVRTSFSDADTRLIDILRQEFTAAASELAKQTGLSESTIFKRRARLTGELSVLLPRARPQLDWLTDRLLLFVPPEQAGTFLRAWLSLPITYISRVRDVESGKETRVLMLAALPTGTAEDIAYVFARHEEDEGGRFHPTAVNAGMDDRILVHTVYDHVDRTWRWDSNDFLDLEKFFTARRRATRRGLPVDLAT